MLIGLCGRAGAGKDTAYGYIEEYAREHDDELLCRRDAFADRLKVSAAAALGFKGTKEESIAFCNELKEGGYIDVNLNDGQDPTFHRITGRKYLQVYGTEAHRDVFGQQFWVDQVLSRYQGFQELLVITDVRFDNEAHAIMEEGGEIWKIVRPGAAIIERTHSSEAGISDDYIDYVITNDSDLAHFRTLVRAKIREFLFWS